MTHWQLGEKQQAREWYDKAVEWMEKNKPNDEELLRFRAEAEELLGLTETLPEEEEKADETTPNKSEAQGQESVKAETDGNQPSSADP